MSTATSTNNEAVTAMQARIEALKASVAERRAAGKPGMSDEMVAGINGYFRKGDAIRNANKR